MERLRFKLIGNELESQAVLIGPTWYDCTINIDTNDLLIKGTNQEEFIFQNKNLTEAKKKARIELIKLGANFTKYKKEIM